jgi:hypothetical protein
MQRDLQFQVQSRFHLRCLHLRIFDFKADEEYTLLHSQNFNLTSTRLRSHLIDNTAHKGVERMVTMPLNLLKPNGNVPAPLAVSLYFVFMCFV